jgi:hypothetical protein
MQETINFIKMHIGLLTESVKRRENLIELGVDGEAMLY